MNTKKKSTGLAAFGAKTQTLRHDEMASERHDVMTPKVKTKASGDVVANTVRLPRAAWLKIQHLALDEGTTFQALAVAGLDNELKRRGLPGFD